MRIPAVAVLLILSSCGGGAELRPEDKRYLEEREAAEQAKAKPTPEKVAPIEARAEDPAVAAWKARLAAAEYKRSKAKCGPEQKRWSKSWQGAVQEIEEPTGDDDLMVNVWVRWDEFSALDDSDALASYIVDCLHPGVEMLSFHHRDPDFDAVWSVGEGWHYTFS